MILASVFLVLSSNVASYSKTTRESVKSVVDQINAEAKLPQPSQKALDLVLGKVRSLRIIDCAMSDLKAIPKSEGTKIALKNSNKKFAVFETSDPRILKELINRLRIRENRYRGRYCLGGGCEDGLSWSAPVYELTLLDGRVIYMSGWEYLRWYAWCGDAELVNSERLFDWLTKRGIKWPWRVVEKQKEYDRKEQKEDEAKLHNFERNMPKSLRSFFGELHVKNAYGLEDISKNYAKLPEERRLDLTRAALSKQAASESDQIGILLEWSGKMSELRLGFQYFPIHLLLEYKPEQVTSKIKGYNLSSTQWVGACRYYTYIGFRRMFPAGYKPLDKKLRARIIKEVKATKKNGSELYYFEEALREWIP
jgi:hypothetical protein